MKAMPVGQKEGFVVRLGGISLGAAVAYMVASIVSGAFLMSKMAELQQQLKGAQKEVLTHKLAAENHRLAAEGCLENVRQQVLDITALPSGQKVLLEPPPPPLVGLRRRCRL